MDLDLDGKWRGREGEQQPLVVAWEYIWVSLLFGPITHANNQTERIKLVKGIKKKQNGLRFLKIPFTSMPFPPATSAHFRFFVESAHGILA